MRTAPSTSCASLRRKQQGNERRLPARFSAVAAGGRMQGGESPSRAHVNPEARMGQTVNATPTHTDGTPPPDLAGRVRAAFAENPGAMTMQLAREFGVP